MLDYIKYRKACKNVFNTTEGKIVLAYLKYDKVDRTAFGSNNDETNKKLAVKEFVQSLCNDVNDPTELDQIIIDNISN